MNAAHQHPPQEGNPDLSAEEQRKKDRIGTLKDRLSIAGAILVFAFLMFMMFADAIENFQCSPWETITFKCNRFDAKFKPWE
jgi:hypothetical protein